MEAANVPCGPIYTIPEMFEDPQVKHRGTKLSLKHSAGVQAPGVANPFKFSETPIEYEKSAPLLSEHTDDILQKDLGLTPEQIQGLRDRGVI
jgi:crotonobetainyl-CoA:carnitine CoA-transferase CaiB-like acyl-CoA transferase